MALQGIGNNKTPGNDGLTKDFFFWDEIKELLINSPHTALYKKELSISQRQAVIIMLTEKKDIDKRFINNWHPISLLNIDYKIVLKALTARLQNILPKIISCDKSAYGKDRIIGKN